LGCGGGVVDEVCGCGESSVCMMFMAVFDFEIIPSFLKLFTGDVHGESVVEVYCSGVRADVAETAV
jgi:hypothetical protein